VQLPGLVNEILKRDGVCEFILKKSLFLIYGVIGLQQGAAAKRQVFGELMVRSSSTRLAIMVERCPWPASEHSSKADISERPIRVKTRCWQTMPPGF
jgi:hypothetical protein